MSTAAFQWDRVTRADQRARVLADRHYNRQKIGAKQFSPPGRVLVLLSRCERAFWVTSWPFRQYVKHRWAGAWICSAFRNEGAGLSSELIRAAVRSTLDVMGEAPWRGMVTFINIEKTAARRSRHSSPGECYLRAGFVRVGETKGGLPALQLLPQRMPGIPPYSATEAQPARIGSDLRGGAS